MNTRTESRPAQPKLRPQIGHDRAMRVAEVEYRRVIATFEELGADDWRRTTVCPGWDVRAMAGHMVGMGEFASSVRQFVRQQSVAVVRAKRADILPIDAMTAFQVDEHAHLSTGELAQRMRAAAPRAVRMRSRLPGLLSRIFAPVEHDRVMERWSMSYLFDTILTRDPFMHRLDIAQATGVQLAATADHEGVIVADVVAEWAWRHGQPYELELTGEAGGRWSSGVNGEQVRMDAFDFCRMVSGRGAGSGLLACHVPF